VVLAASSPEEEIPAIMVYIRQEQLPKLKEYKYSGMYGKTEIKLDNVVKQSR
jgi:hypothetical protein